MPDLKHPTLDLIIPAHNEQENIAALCDQLPWEHLSRVIVVDNASTDNTAELAREHGAVVVHEPQRGYGAACLAGIRWLAQQPVAPQMLGFLDADLADDPAGLVRLCEPIIHDQVDMVIGSRRQLADPGALTPTQRFGNWLACRLIHLSTGRFYHDLGPMRVLRWEALQRLEMRDRTWGWTVEMQFKAASMGLKTQDIHVPYRRRHAGQSKISGTLMGSCRAGYKILMTIGVLWWKQKRR